MNEDKNSSDKNKNIKPINNQDNNLEKKLSLLPLKKKK